MVIAGGFRHTPGGRVWIPAPAVIPARYTVIPAQAGIQNPGVGRTAKGPGRGFPLSRE